MILNIVVLDGASLSDEAPWRGLGGGGGDPLRGNWGGGGGGGGDSFTGNSGRYVQVVSGYGLLSPWGPL